MDVTIDGEAIGQTAAKTYFYKELPPGKHVITSKTENVDTLEIETKPGVLSYVWQEVKLGILSARSKLHLVSEEEGKKGVLESKLAISKSRHIATTPPRQLRGSFEPLDDLFCRRGTPKMIWSGK
jgi:hypothetical protein